MAKTSLTGSWKLVSREYRRSDGPIVHPFGKDEGDTGMIMYDDKGYMSVHHLSANRPDFATNDRLRGTPAEIKAAFEGYSAYYGTYEIDEATSTVTHHITGSLFPNRKGTDQVRSFKLSGNRLTLSTPPMLIGGEEVKATLIWQRTD
jgi:hypothetical protein